jgi:hypothetical protein
MLTMTFALLAALLTPAHPEHEMKEWCFVPEYVLPAEAASTLGPRPECFRDPLKTLDTPPPPMLFQGLTPTDRRTNLLAGDHLPDGPFTCELWVCNHVNQPVGILLAARDGGRTPWALGFHDHTALLIGGADAQTQISSPVRRLAHQEWWYHIVGVFNGEDLQLFVNGRQFGGIPIERSALQASPAARLEIAAYTQNEPLMQIGNLAPWARLYHEALSSDQIARRFEMMKTALHEGWVFPGRLHFAAGPYLNSVTQDSIAILWETDRPTRAVLEHGPTLPFAHRIELSTPARIHETRIDGLSPSTPYYYRVLATDESGQTIDSGTLTFRTAVKPHEPFRFAVLGDTEARPHINDRVAKLIWDQRPDFVVNLGDLTDGGKEPNKFQWNLEYFLGMNQLHSRVPVFPVAGNGEGDLHWYKKYHVLPDPEGFYTFTFGNAQFFMLDTNRPDAEFAPGGLQHEWLKSSAAASTATWKIVCHHHAIYSSDGDDYGNTWKGEPSAGGDPRLRPLAALYPALGIDLVMYGHLHSYERSFPINAEGIAARGVVYIQAGGAGGNLENPAPFRSWFSRATHRGHHHLLFNIHGSTLELTTHDLDGDIIDTMRLAK